MRRAIGVLAGLSAGMGPAVALAEGAGGSYRGIASIYYTFITVVLIYGVYDIFGKKAMYIAAPVIAIGMYVLLPKV